MTVNVLHVSPQALDELEEIVQTMYLYYGDAMFSKAYCEYRFWTLGNLEDMDAVDQSIEQIFRLIAETRNAGNLFFQYSQARFNPIKDLKTNSNKWKIFISLGNDYVSLTQKFINIVNSIEEVIEKMKRSER